MKNLCTYSAFKYFAKGVRAVQNQNVVLDDNGFRLLATVARSVNTHLIKFSLKIPYHSIQYKSSTSIVLLLALVETAMAADILISPLITISGALTQIRRLFRDIFNFRLLDSFDFTCVDTDAQSFSLNSKVWRSQTD